MYKQLEYDKRLTNHALEGCNTESYKCWVSYSANKIHVPEM